MSEPEKKIDQLEKKNIFVTAKGKSNRDTNTITNTNNQETAMKFYEAILKYNKINEATKKLDSDQLAKLAQRYHNHLNKDEKKRLEKAPNRVLFLLHKTNGLNE